MRAKWYIIFTSALGCRLHPIFFKFTAQLIINFNAPALCRSVNELVTGRMRLTLNSTCVAYLHRQVTRASELLSSPLPPRLADNGCPIEAALPSAEATAHDDASSHPCEPAPTKSALLSSTDASTPPVRVLLSRSASRVSVVSDSERQRAQHLERYLGAIFHLHLVPTPAAADASTLHAAADQVAASPPPATLSRVPLSLFTSVRVLDLNEHHVMRVCGLAVRRLSL